MGPHNQPSPRPSGCFRSINNDIPEQEETIHKMTFKNSVNILLSSVALGGSIMHSYVVSPIAFKHMTKEEFGNLQSKIFPLYFVGQAALPVLIGLTSPLPLRFAGPLLGISGFAGALNYLWVLPVSGQIKSDKKKLVAEKRHEKIVDGKVEDSDEFKQLSKKFGMFHGISSLLNLVSIATLGVYGFRLGGLIA